MFLRRFIFILGLGWLLGALQMSWHNLGVQWVPGKSHRKKLKNILHILYRILLFRKPSQEEEEQKEQEEDNLASLLLFIASGSLDYFFWSWVVRLACCYGGCLMSSVSSPRIQWWHTLPTHLLLPSSDSINQLLCPKHTMAPTWYPHSPQHWNSKCCLCYATVAPHHYGSWSILIQGPWTPLCKLICSNPMTCFSYPRSQGMAVLSSSCKILWHLLWQWEIYSCYICVTSGQAFRRLSLEWRGLLQSNLVPIPRQKWSWCDFFSTSLSLSVMVWI